MSRKIRHMIAGILALIMLVSMTDYTGGITGSSAAALELNKAFSAGDLQAPSIVGYRMSPTAELVGIFTLESEELKELEAMFAAELEAVTEDAAGNGEAEEEQSAEEPENTEAEDNDTENTDTEENEPESTEPEMMEPESTEPETTEPETTEPEPVPSIYDGIAVITITEEYLNVRAAGNAEAELVGRMYPGSQGTIIEEANGWYHITSGNVDGWISGKFVVTGAEAETYLKENNLDTKLTVTTAELNIRAQSNADSDCLGQVWKGESYGILGVENGWYLIEFDPGQRGWISGRHVSVGADLGIAMTLAEVEAYEYQKAMEAKAASVGGVLRGATPATEADVALLAALLRHEAGSNSYEACLAVANVVINRMHNGYWGTDMRSVIFAPGQFQYVNDGALDKWMADPGWVCVQAARDALAGINNIGDYIFFCSLKSASTRYDTFTTWVQVGGNVFYKKN